MRDCERLRAAGLCRLPVNRSGSGPRSAGFEARQTGALSTASHRRCGSGPRSAGFEARQTGLCRLPVNMEDPTDPSVRHQSAKSATASILSDTGCWGPSCSATLERDGLCGVDLEDGPGRHHRPPVGHGHASLAGHAPSDGRGRGRRRRLRRGPDRSRARGAVRRPARGRGRAPRHERHDGQSRRADGPRPAWRRDHRSGRHPHVQQRGRRARRHRGRLGPHDPVGGRRHDGPRGGPRGGPRPRRRPRADHLDAGDREHACPVDGPAALAELCRGPRERGARYRRAAVHRWRPAVQRRRRARRAGPRPRPERRLGDVLPVEEPRLSGRLGGRRRRRVHRARPTCPQDGRRRDAPGRGASPRPVWSRSRTARTG